VAAFGDWNSRAKCLGRVLPRARTGEADWDLLINTSSSRPSSLTFAGQAPRVSARTTPRAQLPFPDVVPAD
jgi:hypothetical protein